MKRRRASRDNAEMFSHGHPTVIDRSHGLFLNRHVPLVPVPLLCRLFRVCVCGRNTFPWVSRFKVSGTAGRGGVAASTMSKGINESIVPTGWVICLSPTIPALLRSRRHRPRGAWAWVWRAPNPQFRRPPHRTCTSSWQVPASTGETSDRLVSPTRCNT
jgi:hypothetical protein